MNFGYALLGLAFIFITWGSWAILSAFFDRTLTEGKRMGQLIRGCVTEMIGLVCFLGGYLQDTKLSFAFLVFFGSLFLGSSTGMFHAVVRGRRQSLTQPEDSVPAPSEETSK